MMYVNKALLENTKLTEMEISALTEEAKSSKVDKIVSRLFKAVQSRRKKVNFPEIEESAGDYKKLESHKDITEAIGFLEKISKGGKSKEIEELAKDLRETEAFLIKYKPYFVQGYAKNNTVLKSCYESVVAMMIHLIAYAISNGVEFHNNGIMFESRAKACPKLKKHKGYARLKELLELSRKNKLDKVFKDCLTLTEALSLTTLGLLALALASIRVLLEMFLTARVKLSEYLDTVKDYVELNQANVRDPQIKAKQQKWVARLEKARDRISIDQDVAGSRAEEEIAQENEESFVADDGDDLGLF